MEMRLGKLRSEEHVAHMYIFIKGFTFAVKELEMRHKLKGCSLYIILKQSSNIVGECEQVIVADDSVKCTTGYRIS
jgi:hypothetical protein